MKNFHVLIVLILMLWSSTAGFSQLTEEQYKAQYRDNQLTIDQQFCL